MFCTFAVPIPTFILGPSREEHCQFLKDLKGCDICSNLTYLGEVFVMTLSKLFMKNSTGLLKPKVIMECLREAVV